MEEKGSSMTDGGKTDHPSVSRSELGVCVTAADRVCVCVCAAPVVKIRQSLTKLRQEIVQMDVRIGVVEHTLLQAKLKEKSNMTRDMHATNLPEFNTLSD